MVVYEIANTIAVVIEGANFKKAPTFVKIKHNNIITNMY